MKIIQIFTSEHKTVEKVKEEQDERSLNKTSTNI